MKVLLTLILFSISQLFLSIETEATDGSKTMFSDVDSLICPTQEPVDIFLVWLLYVHLPADRRSNARSEQLGLPYYGPEDFPDGTIPADNNLPTLITEFLREKGTEIVSDSITCVAITEATQDVTLKTNTSNMRFFYVKLDDGYLKLYVRFAPRPVPFPPVIKLDSTFNVIKIVEL